MKINKSPHAKLYVILVAFIMICLIYVFRLAGLQIFSSGDVSSEYEHTTTRTVKIQALRGDLCDVNGKVLVSTKRTYSLAFNYLALGNTKKETNSAILAAATALEQYGMQEHRVSDPYYPFEGTYPSMIYTPAAQNRDTATYQKLSEVAKRNEWAEKISADEFIKKFVKKHELLDVDENGERLFSDEEITEIIRIRYDMELTQFSYMQPYVLATSLPLDFVIKVKELGFSGIDFPVGSEREYHYDGYASHILGRTGRIFSEDWEHYSSLGYSFDSIVGISGCELIFEEYLRGIDGEVTIVEDSDGNVISSKITKEPVAGKNVRLTIDIDVQIAAEDGLKKNVERNSVVSGRKSGAITAIDPKTGKVIALASYPTYELSSYSEDYASLQANTAFPLMNRALSGSYAPGSTFKIPVAYATLESGTANDETIFPCDGIYTKYSGSHGPKCWIYSEAEGWQTHGDQTVTDAIINSCNCYFYEVGDQMGIETMNYYCRRLGFGSKTGIELGERTPILAGLEYAEQTGLGKWYPGQTLAAAIGQSYNSFTPLQITSGISTFVSGGYRYEVHLLDSVYNFDGTLYLKKEPKLLDKASIKPSTLSTIKNAMGEMASTNATVITNMQGVPVSVGGKTGTSQTGAYYDDALFTSFAPLNDPEIVVTCVIERGVSGANASAAVGDLYREFFKNR